MSKGSRRPDEATRAKGTNRSYREDKTMSQSVAPNMKPDSFVQPTREDSFPSEYAAHIQEDETDSLFRWADSFAQPAEGEQQPTPATQPQDDEGVFGTVYRNVAEIPKAAVHGAVEGTNEAVQFLYELGDTLRGVSPDWMNYSLNAKWEDDDMLPSLSIDEGAPQESRNSPTLMHHRR